MSQQMVERTEHQVAAPSQQDQMNGLISVIERLATNPEADIEKLERMLLMQERILDRQAQQEYSNALAQLQGELPEAERDLSERLSA